MTTNGRCVIEEGRPGIHALEKECEDSLLYHQARRGQRPPLWAYLLIGGGFALGAWLFVFILWALFTLAS